LEVTRLLSLVAQHFLRLHSLLYLTLNLHFRNRPSSVQPLQPRLVVLNLNESLPPRTMKSLSPPPAAPSSEVLPHPQAIPSRLRPQLAVLTIRLRVRASPVVRSLRKLDDRVQVVTSHRQTAGLKADREWRDQTVTEREIKLAAFLLYLLYRKIGKPIDPTLPPILHSPLRPQRPLHPRSHSLPLDLKTKLADLHSPAPSRTRSVRVHELLNLNRRTARIVGKNPRRRVGGNGASRRLSTKRRRVPKLEEVSKNHPRSAICKLRVNVSASLRSERDWETVLNSQRGWLLQRTISLVSQERGATIRQAQQVLSDETVFEATKPR